MPTYSIDPVPSTSSAGSGWVVVAVFFALLAMS
jgi:hypothetical protein